MSRKVLIKCETIKVKVNKEFLSRIKLNKQFKYYSDMEEFIIDAMRKSIESMEKNH